MAVTAGGPAGEAGIAGRRHVLSIDGTLTPDSQTLIDAVAAHQPGDMVQIKVQHQDGTDGDATR